MTRAIPSYEIGDAAARDGDWHCPVCEGCSDREEIADRIDKIIDGGSWTLGYTRSELPVKQQGIAQLVEEVARQTEELTELNWRLTRDDAAAEQEEHDQMVMFQRVYEWMDAMREIASDLKQQADCMSVHGCCREHGGD